jgi:hypothetical protein
LAAAEKKQRFFYRIFLLPLFRNAQKRDKKTEQNNRGREKKRGKKAQMFFCVFLNSPCYATPKNAIKKSINK